MQPLTWGIGELNDVASGAGQRLASPFQIEVGMCYKFARWSSVVVAAAVVAACSDAREPMGPSNAVVRTSAAPGAQDRLARWFAQSSPVVLALPGTVFADNDEANNRLLFGVENAAAIVGVRNALTHLDIPSSAYAIKVTEPIHFVATLQDEWRPTQAGIQIHFFRFLCSLGFNADDGSERSMMTASHCTRRPGGVEGTLYYQPTSTVDPTVIATEVEDPIYFRGGVCPRGRKCRYSDAARSLYSEGVGSSRGAIAKTSGPNNGSIDVTGAFTITTQDNATTNFGIGTTVNKVGRTTGWTQANVTQTCVNTNVFQTNTTLLCQTFVEDPGGATVVGAGDSSSPVFAITGGDNVQAVGMLWGGSSNDKVFIFSPLKQIRDELGAITVTQ